jgi:hypothetical protein
MIAPGQKKRSFFPGIVLISARYLGTLPVTPERLIAYLYLQRPHVEHVEREVAVRIIVL